MYDTIMFEFDYSNDGNEFNINSKLYLENNSLLIDRKFKNSRDAVATKRIRYSDISDVSLNDSSVSITYSKGSVYLKNDDSEIAKDFYDKLSEKI